MIKAKVTTVVLVGFFMISSIASADWIYYDDGNLGSWWTWNDPQHDCGWGIRVIAPDDGWVDSIATYFYLSYGDSAMFRIYGALPNNMPDSNDIRVESSNVHLYQHGWNRFSFDTTLTHMDANEMFFPFYLQLGNQYNAPYFGIDAVKDYPAYMMQLRYGEFESSWLAGDHMQRVHFVTSPGIGEWLEPGPFSKKPEVSVSSPLSGDCGTVSFSLPEPMKVSIRLYDITGRPVQDLVKGNFKKGTFVQRFSISELSSGIYIIKLEAEGHMIVVKTVVLK